MSSRNGTIGKPRRRKDGTLARRIRWYDAEGERQSEIVTGDFARARRRLDTRLREVEDAIDGLRRRASVRETPPTLDDVAARAGREVLPLRQRKHQVLRTLIVVKRWWSPELGERPVDHIETSHVRAVLSRARAAQKRPATCNRALSALSVILEAAVEWGYIGSNPCRAPGLRQREARKAPRYLGGAEARAVIEAAEPRWRPFFAMAIYEGLRFGELTALRWRDVDLLGGWIHVRASHGDDPKGRHHRSLPIHSELRPLLPPAGDPEHLVFLGRARGGRRREGCGDPERDCIVSPQKALTRALAGAGVQRHLSIHDLRHTAATLWLEAGVSPRVVQDLLGHSTLAMTSRYLHVGADTRAALERLRLVGDGGNDGPET